MIDPEARLRRQRRISPGRAYLDRLDAPKRALTRLIEELDDFDEDDRDRILLAGRAMSIREPVLLLPNAVKIAQCAAEADIRRIWAKYHPDTLMEDL